jgi:hypothetical protein
LHNSNINLSMNNFQKGSEWLTERRVLEYLSRSDSLHHRKEGEDGLVKRNTEPYKVIPTLIFMHANSQLTAKIAAMAIGILC